MTRKPTYEELEAQIKALKKAESAYKTELCALKNSADNYRTIFDSANDGIFIHSPVDGSILDVNPKILKMYGYSKEEALNLDVGSISKGVPPYSNVEAKAYIEKAVKGEPQVFEWISKRKNGDLFWVEVSLKNIILDGEDRIIAIVRDISTRKQAEQEQKRFQEQLAQSQKMESVGRLAAGMAHEINNPLAGVVQNTYVLANRLNKTSMPANIEAAESLGTTVDIIHEFMERRGILRIVKAITESSLRMSSIVENILNFARKSDASFSSHDPVRLMEDILTLARADYSLKTEYDFKAIVIQKEYQDNLPMIVCQGSKIQQVILNILNNGAYAMFQKKENMAAFEPTFILRLSNDIETRKLKIEIEDNGIGMDAETCRKLFEPFFTTKPEGLGTGLGMFVSYFIITKHHKGKMNVISSPGKGTNFIIHLPFQR